MSANNTGWIPPSQRTKEQTELDEAIKSSMPRFALPVKDEGRYQLWKLAEKGLKRKLQYAHQLTGSCFPAGTPVRTADGFEKPIENIKVGDEVTSHTGARRRVVEVMTRPFTGDLVTLNVKGYAFPLTMTADHQVAVMRANCNWRWQPDYLEWVRADEIQEGDRVIIGWSREAKEQELDLLPLLGDKGVDLDQLTAATSEGHGAYSRAGALRSSEFVRSGRAAGRIKLWKSRNKNSIFRRVAVSESFARLIGLYLAEGGIDEGRITFTFSAEERNTLAAETTALVRGLFGVDGSIKHEPEKGRTTVRFANQTLTAVFEALVPGNVYTKRVPGVIFSSSDRVKAALVGGWMAGDGYYKPADAERDPRIQGVTVSADLARDMTTLALSVGYRASCSIRKAYKQSKAAYDVYLSGPGARVAIAAAKGQPVDTVTRRGDTDTSRCEFGYCREVRKVEREAVVGRQVYDFEVEEDHSFLAGGLVVHNCVGAGGYSCSLTLMGVEIALGEAEEFQQIFWPWTYGQSRRLGGLNGQGEGSFGTAYFKAARECGYFAVSEGHDLALPQFRVVDGWLQLSREAELKYSNGAAFAGEPYASRAKKHLINQGAQAFTVPDALGLLQSGYPLTIASLMGTRTITPQGNGENRVNVAKWDDTWAHQMFIDEAWKNPDLGWIFRVGNNWGNAAHPAPVNDSPGGGFYITEATLDKNLKSGDCELFGFGGLAGFPAREIDWYI